MRTNMWLDSYKDSGIPSPPELKSRLNIDARILWIYFRSSDDVRSAGEDFSVDYKDVCGDFVHLKTMCHLSLSKVLIGVVCTCVFINVSVCAYV